MRELRQRSEPPTRHPFMMARFVPTLILPLVLVAACAEPGGSSAGPASPTVRSPASTPGAAAGSLWHRTFVSTAVSSGGRPRSLVSGTRILLAFEPGRLRAEAGCNQLTGEVRADGGRLAVPSLAATDKYCGRPGQEQDTWLSAFLTSGPSWTLDGDVLVLRSSQAEVRLVDRQAAGQAKPLRGTRWTVRTIGEGGVARSVPAGATAYLVIDEQGAVHGSTGCNTFSGHATTSADAVTFSATTVTKRMCSRELAELESVVLAVLGGKVTVRLEADTLTMTLPDGRMLGLSATA